MAYQFRSDPKICGGKGNSPEYLTGGARSEVQECQPVSDHLSEHVQFLRTPEAAALLRISPRTLEKHRCQGTGPPFRRAGGTILYTPDDLIAWTVPDRSSDASE